MRYTSRLAFLLGALALFGCSSDGSGTGDPSQGDGTAGGDGSAGDGSSDGTGGGDGAPGDGTADGTQGDGASGDGASSDGASDPDGGSEVVRSTFRADSFVLVSPRAWGKTPIVNTPVEVTQQVNDEFAKVLVEDNGPNNMADGYVDLNMFVGFDDPTASEGAAQVGGGQCEAPLSDAACGPDPAWPFTPLHYASQTEGTCLESAGKSVAAPCFVSDKADLVVTLGAFRNLPLKDFQIAGRLGAGTPPTRIDGGLIRGFLTEADAMAATLPDDLPAFAALFGIEAGAPLSSALHADEQEERDGVKGWWVTTTVTAAAHAFAP